MSALERYFNHIWYGQSAQRWLFWPASLLTDTVVRHKRDRFLRRPPVPLSVPVVVVGNLTVGGTGKTPLLLHLIDAFRARGFKPGVISRGYGGKGPFPLSVKADTSPDLCGDEPAMIARRTGVPLVVDPDRMQAARHLLAETSVDVIFSDDGLQHYRLPRQLEIVVIDGQRGFGNHRLLPMGPLREPIDRLQSIAFAVVNGEMGRALQSDLAGYPNINAYRMDLQPGNIRRLDGSGEASADAFHNKSVIALAGIGNPERFFNTLKSLSITFKPQVFADHHRYVVKDFSPIQRATVIMTEKDAVKVRPDWLSEGWYLPVNAAITGSLVDDIIRALRL